MTKTLVAYHHGESSPQEPDPRPGNYYVSCWHGIRYALLLGPFPTHQEALDNVRQAWAKTEEVDPRAYWYAFGTARTADDYRKPGTLNRFFPELFEQVASDSARYHDPSNPQIDADRGDDR